MIPQKEMDRIRSLAEHVREFAHEPRMAAIQKRWSDVNELRTPDRAPVWCRPVGCWSEILTNDKILCETPWIRNIEVRLLQDIHKRSIGDDTPIESTFRVATVFDRSNKHTWGVPVGRHAAVGPGGSWAYDPPLKREEDFEKLETPRFTYNHAKTQEGLERVHELLGDILPVKRTCGPLLGAIIGTAVADLRGLEQMMMDMIMAPELLHRLTTHVQKSVLSALDDLDASGQITPNNDTAMRYCDPIGQPDENGVYSANNLWCVANSQEYDQVSPAMWEEFCLDYQKPIFERFGLVGYGCCENLTQKVSRLLTIPNLRIITCSAWTNLDTVMDVAGDKYCIMWRQKASDVVFPDAPAGVKKALQEGASRLKGHYYQIVLRELETLAGHPNRLHEWTRFAIDAAERYS